MGGPALRGCEGRLLGPPYLPALTLSPSTLLLDLSPSHMPAGSRWTPASSPRTPPPVPLAPLPPQRDTRAGAGCPWRQYAAAPLTATTPSCTTTSSPRRERASRTGSRYMCGGGASSSLHTPHVPSWYRECATGRNLVRTLNDEEGMREQFCFCRLPPPGRYLCIRGGCHGMHARCSRCGC